MSGTRDPFREETFWLLDSVVEGKSMAIDWYKFGVSPSETRIICAPQPSHDKDRLCSCSPGSSWMNQHNELES